MNFRAVLTQSLTLFICALFAAWLLSFVAGYMAFRLLRWVFLLPTSLMEGCRGSGRDAARRS